MDLKRFLPNKTLVWKEWKNYWSFISISFGYFTFMSSFQLIQEILDYKYLLRQGIFNDSESVTYIMDQTAGVLSFNGAEIGIGSILFTIGLAAMMMGLERDQNTFNLLLAMPYSRQEILYNKFIVGLGQLLVVLGLNALIMNIIIWVNPGIPFPFGGAEIWAWALRYILVLSFVFTFTMLISGISGTTLGNLLLTPIFLFFPVGFLGLILVNIRYLASIIPGMHYWNYRLYKTIEDGFDTIGVLTVPIYIIDGHTITQFNLVLIYSILLLSIVGIYKLTQYLFTKNQLENNGEVLMFEKLEGFFKIGVTICFALLGGPLLMELLGLRHQVIAVISYLFAGGLFWLLVTQLIKWRKMA